MPKKRKKEKIIAELRRKLKTPPPIEEISTTQNQNTLLTKPEPFQPAHSLSTFTLPKTFTKSSTVQSSTMTISPSAKTKSIDLSHIRQDIKKIVVTTGLAITFEAMVYWFIVSQKFS